MSNTTSKPALAFTLPPSKTLNKPNDADDCNTHALHDDEDGGLPSERRRRERGKKRRRGLRSRLEDLSPAYTLENSGSVGELSTVRNIVGTDELVGTSERSSCE